MLCLRLYVPLQLVHRRQELALQINVIGMGEDEYRPEAIGEFMRELGVGIGNGTDAVARLNKLHQITNIADETQRDLLVGPLPAITPPLHRRVALADGKGTML